MRLKAPPRSCRPSLAAQVLPPKSCRRRLKVDACEPEYRPPAKRVAGLTSVPRVRLLQKPCCHGVRKRLTPDAESARGCQVTKMKQGSSVHDRGYQRCYTGHPRDAARGPILPGAGI